MAHCTRLGRYERAKSETLDGRCSVNSMKNEFRNKFFNRLRTVRSKSVDRFRQICVDHGYDIEVKSVYELRNMLSQNTEASALLNTEEISEVIKQIEDEMRLVEIETQAETYLQESNKETETILSTLMNTCFMCQSLTENLNSICISCQHVINSKDFQIQF